MADQEVISISKARSTALVCSHYCSREERSIPFGDLGDCGSLNHSSNRNPGERSRTRDEIKFIGKGKESTTES